MKRLLPILLIMAAVLTVRAGDPPVTVEADVMASLSTGRNTPFWLTANREGLGSIRRGTGYVRAAAFRTAPGERRLTWGFGADLLASWRSEAPFAIRQLYGELRYRDFILSVGSRAMADTARLVNRRLSSGDLLFSGNALPLPEVRLAMPCYLDIPGLRHWLGFKAYISYGMFTDGAWQRSRTGGREDYTEDVLFHSKGLFLRIGPADAPFTFEGGLEMAAQFGGKLMRGDSVVARMPSRFKDWLKVLIPGSGGEDAYKGEQTNILGNHVGEWSARLTWRPAGQPWQLAAYYLHFFDDHSMMFFDHRWKDGLWGIEYRRPGGGWLTGAVYEFLSTTDQSGPVYWDHTPAIPEQVSGRDDYYNNYIYQAWQHWGMGLGNPLVLSPVYNADGSIAFRCNRIRGHHWAVEGQPHRELGYRLLCSYTRGWGTYKWPYREVKSNVNLLVEASYTPRRLAGWQAALAVGADMGHMLGRSLGASLTLSYRL